MSEHRNADVADNVALMLSDNVLMSVDSIVDSTERSVLRLTDNE